MTRPLRIAILAHSTNPRGGVVHALALGEALTEQGHDAVVHAPARPGQSFFRNATCGTVLVPASPSHASLAGLVEARIGDYVAHFVSAANRRFDIFHAQDGISGNALATLKARGHIKTFARTVHHIDSFADPHVAALQSRSIEQADSHFVVSGLWRDALKRDFGISAIPVGNGVDRETFSKRPDGREALLRARLGLGAGPVFLSIGGIEQRKNTLRMLQAFRQIRVVRPMAQFVIAGGASLLDHDAYQAEFRQLLLQDSELASSVIIAGPLPQHDMPMLYRLADALVFASIKEGFGLVALEAIACGTPVVTSRIPPFTEHFGDDDVVWCNPHEPGSIANAMHAVLIPKVRERLAARAESVLEPHRWERCATAHLPGYAALREPVDA